MTATFTTRVTNIRTGAVGDLTDVIKRVDFNVIGTEGGQTFELPQSIEIADPDPAVFIRLPNVTEADVIRWIGENFTNTEAVQLHIQRVLNDMMVKASFEPKPMPWQPAAEVPTTPAP